MNNFFWYKIKKIFKNDFIKSNIDFLLIMPIFMIFFTIFFPIIFFKYKNDRFEAFIILIISIIVNGLVFLLFSLFQINFLFKVLFILLSSYFLFFLFCFFISICDEYKNISLNTCEKRDAILEKLLK